jgi:hypothetical protein
MRVAVASRKLCVFDFDDTLVSSESSITVEHGDGELTVLDSASFAYFKGTGGDKIDFSDFNNVSHPHIIKKNMDSFKKAAASGSRMVILTARAKSAASSVKKFMDHLGLKNVEVVALQSSNPMDKADWIEANAGDVEEVEFTDDSSRNVAAVDTLQGKIKGKLTTFNTPHPSEKDYDGESLSEVFETDDPVSVVQDIPKKPSESHLNSPWWTTQTPEFKRQYCKEHPESKYCGCKVASSESQVRALTMPFDSAQLECDGMTRVLHTVLADKHISHTVKAGGVQWGEHNFSPHFWIELPGGKVVDYRLRMWFGRNAPHGVFDPRKEGVAYTGRTMSMQVLPDYLFEMLSGRAREAGFREVVDKIVRRVRDSEIAQRMIDKVRRYLETKNPADDLSSADVSAIYRQDDYGDDFDMPGGKELDVGWTNHAEYRCDLRDVDPSRVNEQIRNFAELHPHTHQKVNLTRGNGRAVVDVNTTVNPEEAAVVTVIAAVKVPKATGNCYEAAGNYMMNEGPQTNAILVQGEVLGRGPVEGIRFGHSWIEKGGMVFEVANGKNTWLPMDLYYTLGDIKRTKKYPYAAAIRWMLKTGNYGPWELKTRY